MDKLESLQLFCRIVELGSYSEVARERYVSRSGISRSVTQLERYFGVQLFKRSTRVLSLTEAGRELYAESQHLLRQFESLEDRIGRDRTEVKGLLRVGVPGPLSERYLLPDLPLFHERFPQIQLFFQVSESLSDLYRDELDMVVRMGSLGDSSLVSVKLASLSFVLAASPEFIKNHSLEHPNQLKEVNCLCFRGRGRGSTWNFRKGSQKTAVPVAGFLTADCGYTLRHMAVAGQGVAGMPRPLLKEELESGQLVEILPEWTLSPTDEEMGIHLLYHSNRRPLKRVRAFIDFMKEPERLIHFCH